MSAEGTIGQALTAAAARLREAGFAAADAALDADVLLRHVLACDRATLLMRRGEPLPPDTRSTFDDFIDRRRVHEPVAYITGTREFYGRDFQVSPAVLIPRPETELIVDAVLARTPRDAARRVADVCTGSGILAVTLACERPAWTVVATDISPAALALARSNVTAHGVADRVTLVETDLLTGVPGRFDLIVSNPPYVPERDAPALAADVRDFEPGVALFGGMDGLAIVARLLPDVAARLVPAGLFIVEFGAGQQYDVARHATRAGFEVLEVVADLQGHPRIAVCRLRADL